MNYLLDTNIVSYHLKQNQKIRQYLKEAKIAKHNIFISCITYYEIKRGLLYANATTKITLFNDFVSQYEILFLNENILEKACEIHANLKRQGRMIQDADILIAATAIIHDLILVSNDSDLTIISEVNLENWLT